MRENEMARDQIARERVERLVREGADTDAIVAAALQAAPAPGECRIQDGTHDSGDYPDVRPVLTKDGLQWCCTFGHCSEAASPLGSKSVAP
jgi:hypothetical protein